jgi:hypothetical protein
VEGSTCRKLLVTKNATLVWCVATCSEEISFTWSKERTTASCRGPPANRERAQQEEKRKRKRLRMMRTPQVVALISDLKRRREELHRCCVLGVELFRRDSVIVDLVDSVRTLVRNLKERSECHIEWMAFMMELDLVSMLLRAESIARREVTVSESEAKEVILLVWELLPERMYQQYVGRDGEGGEVMIVNAWTSMLDKRDGDGEAFGQVSREMYTIMRGVHAHTGKHHAGGKMPDCVEYRNVVEGWNAMT